MKTLKLLLMLMFAAAFVRGQDVVITETSQLNLDPNEYNILTGNDIHIGNGEVLIKDGEQLEVVAKEKVELLPGFKAETGSHFQAHIDTTSVNAVPEKVDDALQVKVFPNPAKEKIIIEFEKSAADLDLYLTNPEGKILQHQHIRHQQQTEMDIRDLPGGTYLLQIVDEKEKQAGIHKIIK